MSVTDDDALRESPREKAHRYLLGGIPPNSESQKWRKGSVQILKSDFERLNRTVLNHGNKLSESDRERLIAAVEGYVETTRQLLAGVSELPSLEFDDDDWD